MADTGVSNGLCEHLRAVCLYLRARAVVKFFSLAASTLVSTDGEQRALPEKYKKTNSEHFEYFVNFFSSRNLSFINRIRCFASSDS